jgi:hypothetical protein
VPAATDERRSSRRPSSAGVGVRILESHSPDEAEVGSYFTATANGLAALDAIDARGLAEAAGFRTRRNAHWNDFGRRLAALPLDSCLVFRFLVTAKSLGWIHGYRIHRDGSGTDAAERAA